MKVKNISLTDSGTYHDDLLSEEAKEVIGDVKDFLDSEEWYKTRGIKFRRGYLLHGNPGSGKSTLITIIAQKFKLPLYYIRSQDFLRNAGELLSNIPSKSLIVVEDIDTALDYKREKVKSNDEFKDSLSEDNKFNFELGSDAKKLLLGEVLNAIDGIISFEGSILMCTTNDVNSLDGALIRPGRMDMIKEIKPLSPDLVVKMFKYFFEHTGEVIHNDKSLTIAELQSILLVYKDSYEKAAKELEFELL